MISPMALPMAIVGLVFVIWLFNCLNITREYDCTLFDGPRL